MNARAEIDDAGQARGPGVSRTTALMERKPTVTPERATIVGFQPVALGRIRSRNADLAAFQRQAKTLILYSTLG
ncbi:MAG: hypothetical protein P9F19_06695 [Candidatus Contendobacter sp.]|nr:hypothetical protein [Candidatus Contendobacter sp.]MDG4557059.1 hypothetical protein [Candidatus Contendobacter sp.]